MVDPRLKDKDWRLSHLYKIVDKNSNEIIFNENNRPVLADFNHSHEARNIILKSRQHGFTTNACIDGLDDVIFNANFNFTLIADTKEHAREIFEKVIFAWVNFPQALKSALDIKASTENANEISFNHGSKFRVTTSARSGTVNRLHISEFGKICAQWPKKAKEIITGSIPAVVPSGRIDIESTAEGEEGEFYEMFWRYYDKEPESIKDWKTFFYGWANDPDCNLTGIFDLPQDMIEYQKLHGLSRSQINWYFKEKGTLRSLMLQEYPTTPEEAFIGSGEKLFDHEEVSRRLKNDVRDGQKIGDWEYFVQYKPNHDYGQGADVAEGIGRDSSTIAVIDFNTNEVVAIYENNKIDASLFAYELRNSGFRHGFCITGIERNNHGHATLAKLNEIYPSECIYKEVKTDEVNQKQTKKLGWHTNGSTKPKLLYDLKSAVDDGILKIYHKGALLELRAYDRKHLNETVADPEASRHYDILMAIAIAWEMRKSIVKYKKEEHDENLEVEEAKVLYNDIGI